MLGFQDSRFESTARSRWSFLSFCSWTNKISKVKHRHTSQSRCHQVNEITKMFITFETSKFFSTSCDSSLETMTVIIWSFAIRSWNRFADKVPFSVVGILVNFYHFNPYFIFKVIFIWLPTMRSNICFHFQASQRICCRTSGCKRWCDVLKQCRPNTRRDRCGRCHGRKSSAWKSGFVWRAWCDSEKLCRGLYSIRFGGWNAFYLLSPSPLLHDGEIIL